jgi:hypothetical protein
MNFKKLSKNSKLFQARQRFLRSHLGYVALLVTTGFLFVVLTPAILGGALLSGAHLGLNTAFALFPSLTLVNVLFYAKVATIFLFGYAGSYPRVGISPSGTGGTNTVLIQNILPRIFYTLSSQTLAQTGYLNGGADFGYDTPGTNTAGWKEFAAKVGSTGGTGEVGPGVYQGFGNYVLITGSNIQFSVDPGAQIIMPTNPSWSISVGTAANKRLAMFVFSQCTNVTWNGGYGTMVSGTAQTRAPFFLIGDNNTYLKIRNSYITGTGYFPILMSGIWTDNSTGITLSGAYTYITEEENEFVNNGSVPAYGGAFPDGGGVRLQNVTNPGAACHHISLGLNTKIILNVNSAGLFGYDFLNPTAINPSAVNNITVYNPSMDLGTGSGSRQVVGLNIESTTTTCTDMAIIDPHITGGYRGCQLDGGWSRITFVAGTYALAGQQGIQCITTNAANFCTLSDVQFIGPRCISNNQLGLSNARGSGLVIGFDGQNSVPGSITTNNVQGVMFGISIYGGSYSDPQTTPTQQYGVAIQNLTNAAQVTAAAVGGILSGVFITGGTTIGNVVSGIGFAQSIASNTTGGVVDQLVIGGVNGFNPVGIIATPFTTIGQSLITVYGNSQTLLATTNYRVMIQNCVMSFTGGTGAQITIYGPDGTQVLLNATTPQNNVSVPFGSILTTNAFGAAPTMTVTSNGTAIANTLVLGPLGTHVVRQVGLVGGSASTPANNVLNRVMGTGIYLSVSGGAVSAINLYDPGGNSFGTLGTQCSGQYIAPLFIYGVNYSVAPTETIFGY